MPFDLATAKPVAAAAPASGGFDLSTAKPVEETNAVLQTVRNIPSSAKNFASGIYQTVLHPLQTGMTLWDLGAGGLQHFLMPESWKQGGPSFAYSPRAENTFNAAKQFYGQRYGGLQNIKRTVEQDPVGVLGDVSAIAGGVGGGARLAGDVARAANLTRTASTLSKAGEAASNVSRVTNPLNAAAQAARPAAAIGKNLYGWMIGLASSSGKHVIDEAIKYTPEFVQAMRGNLTDRDVFELARQGVQTLRDERKAAYMSQLRNLKGSNQRLDISPIKAKMDKILSEYNVTKNPDGTLDFSRSSLSKGAGDIESMYRDVETWGSRPGDDTPLALDILKRRMSDKYSESGQARAAAADMANTIKGLIVRAVPAYEKMTSDYSKSSETIESIDRALSTGDRAYADTALRKIMTAMREDTGTRRALISNLDSRTGQNLTGAAAGRVMSQMWSNRLGNIGHVYGTSMVAAFLHNPLLLALMPLASPRIAGEMTVALAKMARAAGKAGKAAVQPLNIAERGTAPLQGEPNAAPQGNQ